MWFGGSERCGWSSAALSGNGTTTIISRCFRRASVPRDSFGAKGFLGRHSDDAGNGSPSLT